MRITDQTTIAELAQILQTMGVRAMSLQIIDAVTSETSTRRTQQWSASIQHGPRGRQYDGGYATVASQTINEAASQLGLAIATQNQDK